MGSAVQFRRGQVWYVDDNYQPIGSIQGKSRPYLVVSNDACNRFSPVIHMAPITSQNKKLSQPTHVQFFNPRRKQNNWILLEQTMPKSIPDIVDVSDYQYTLSAETMQEVDKALSIQFALKSFGVDIADFEAMLDMIVEQKIAQIQDATQSLLDARMSKYVSALLDRVADAGKIPDPKVYIPGPVVLEQMQYAPATAFPHQDEAVATPVPTVTVPEVTLDRKSQPAPAKDDKPRSAIDKFNAKWGKSTSAPKVAEPVPEDSRPNAGAQPIQITRPEIIRTKSGRVRWSTPLKKQFIDDMASYGPQKVSSIWDLDVKCLHAYKYRFTKELAEAGLLGDKSMHPAAPKKSIGRRKASKNAIEVPQTTSEMLKDYDEMPISKFMEKYNIPTRAQAVEVAAKLRIG